MIYLALVYSVCTMKESTNIEKLRLELQDELDGSKKQEERNRFGQFATPAPLALDILAYASELLSPDMPIRFLDPALGTGAFYSALRETFEHKRILRSTGFEIDSHYALPAKDLWAACPLKIHLGDFTKHAHPTTETKRFNLIVCNPPYVRHHHLSSLDKSRLREAVRLSSGIHINGLSGLYCYFLCLSHAWMMDGGIAIWLIPSEFMDVNYGLALKRYLLEKVTLLRIHRFDPNHVQFEDASVSSAIVSFIKKKPGRDVQVEFTYGGSLLEPDVSRTIETQALVAERKWTRFPLESAGQTRNGPTLGDFFAIKRGLATGGNSFFIMSKSEIEERNLPLQCFRPILPSPRFLAQEEVEGDASGNPLIEKKLFLLDCRMSEEELRKRYSSLYDYLETGKPEIANRYLCKHRKPWYAQEIRPPSPFVCTYLGRKDTKNGRPFRFILNHSNATATNVYLLLYPKRIVTKAMEKDPQLSHRILEVLNSVPPEDLLREGRFYGGGLHKLEPKELKQVPVPQLLSLIPDVSSAIGKQMDLFAVHVR